ncbi:MAG: DUF4339 domain-containing protein [Candidatus Methylacidiphilales bacterium]|nr:DUF4339 domain-containing protein [Candidatus Methylacidiphilales bacterium]
MKLFVLKDGHQTGPFTPEQVQDLLLREYFKPSDLSWHEELVSWQALSVVLPDLLTPAFRSGFSSRGDKAGGKKGGSRPASGEWLPPLHFDDDDLDLSPPPPPRGLDTEIAGGKCPIAVSAGTPPAETGPAVAPPSAVLSLRMAVAGVALYPPLFLAAAFALPVPPLHSGVMWLGICTVTLLLLNVAGMAMATLTALSPRTRTTSAILAMILHGMLLLGMAILLGIGMLIVP